MLRIIVKILTSKSLKRFVLLLDKYVSMRQNEGKYSLERMISFTMKEHVDQGLEFEPIIGTPDQIKTLYDLLRKRPYNISHRSMPAPSEHAEFVAANPYLMWYLISFAGCFIGDVYVMNNNCIGVNLLSSSIDKLKGVISFVMINHSPLPCIKSVRPPSFYINVAPNNEQKIQVLEGIGAKAIQITYTLADFADCL